jgi:hypothetical protein
MVTHERQKSTPQVCPTCVMQQGERPPVDGQDLPSPLQEVWSIGPSLFLRFWIQEHGSHWLERLFHSYSGQVSQQVLERRSAASRHPPQELPLTILIWLRSRRHGCIPG